MAAIDFPRILMLVTLLTTSLTSSISIGPDGTSSVSPVPDHDNSLKPSSETVKHSTNAANDIKVLKLLYTSGMAEGGPISLSTTTQHSNIEDTAVTGSDKPVVSKIRENVPKERNANPSVVARKGVEDKIKPRKGVFLEKANVSSDQTTFEDIKPIVESSSTVEIAQSNSRPEISNIPKLNTADSRSNDSLDRSTNSNYSSTNPSIANVTAFHIETTNNTTTSKVSTHIEKHIPKPKPTVTTVDGPEVNESRLPSRTKSPPLGMPRKIDYIVPVIITMVTIPILGAAIFVLYRRGRDCWDKRHYRRMDFLIDGMYND